MQQVMTHSTTEPTVSVRMLLQLWLSNVESVWSTSTVLIADFATVVHY